MCVRCAALLLCSLIPVYAVQTDACAADKGVYAVPPDASFVAEAQKCPTTYSQN
jgi:hypothetical protein